MLPQPPAGLAARALARATLDQFTFAPAIATPFGTTRLEWRITVDGTPEVPLAFILHGPGGSKQVSTSGHRTISPTDDTTYTLTAFAGLTKRLLGTAVVTVNLDGCRIVDVPEDVIRPFFIQAVSDEITKHEGITNRKSPTMEIEEAGLVVTLRLKKSSAWFDPSIDINARYQLRSQGDAVEVKEVQFAYDIDVPLWFDPDHDGDIEALRGVLLAKLGEYANLLLSLNQGTDRLFRFETQKDRLELVFCPRPRLTSLSPEEAAQFASLTG